MESLKLQWHQSKEFDDKRIFVRTHPFFAKWTESEIEQLVSCLKKRIISAGKCAFLQGSDVKCLHFLVRYMCVPYISSIYIFQYNYISYFKIMSNE